MEQILIKNGRVWDGERFYDADVLSDGGIISKIAPNISCEKAYVYDAAGKIVSAGLVDSHVHMHGLSGAVFAIAGEMACFPFGVTAAVEAGGRLGDEALMDQMAVKSLMFPGSRIENDHLDREDIRQCLARYGERALGIKLYFDDTSPNVISVAPLQEVCTIARELGVKVMVHCSQSPIPMEDVVKTLAPGDILTHIFHGGKHDCTENDFAALHLAREKGVVLDAGFAGHVHTDFRVLRKAFAAGFYPDTISSDITCNSAFKRGGRYGMTMCMSMARTAGMAEEDIMRAVTSTPAAVLGRQWGRLAIGGCADIAVLDYPREGFCLTDQAGNCLRNEQGYRCVLTVADGNIVYAD